VAGGRAYSGAVTMGSSLVRGDTSNIEGGDQIIPDLANVALLSFAG